MFFNILFQLHGFGCKFPCIPHMSIQPCRVNITKIEYHSFCKADPTYEKVILRELHALEVQHPSVEQCCDREQINTVVYMNYDLYRYFLSYMIMQLINIYIESLDDWINIQSPV